MFSRTSNTCLPKTSKIKVLYFEANNVQQQQYFSSISPVTTGYAIQVLRVKQFSNHKWITNNHTCPEFWAPIWSKVVTPPPLIVVFLLNSSRSAPPGETADHCHLPGCWTPLTLMDQLGTSSGRMLWASSQTAGTFWLSHHSWYEPRCLCRSSRELIAHEYRP